MAVEMVNVRIDNYINGLFQRVYSEKEGGEFITHDWSEAPC